MHSAGLLTLDAVGGKLHNNLKLTYSWLMMELPTVRCFNRTLSPVSFSQTIKKSMQHDFLLATTVSSEMNWLLMEGLEVKVAGVAYGTKYSSTSSVNMTTWGLKHQDLCNCVPLCSLTPLQENWSTGVRVVLWSLQSLARYMILSNLDITCTVTSLMLPDAEHTKNIFIFLTNCPWLSTLGYIVYLTLSKHPACQTVGART